MLNGPIRHETRDLAVIADGDLAVAHALAHTTATQTNGKPMEMWYRVSLAFRKVGGRWLVTREHSSVAFEPQSMRNARRATSRSRAASEKHIAAALTARGRLFIDGGSPLREESL
jgi:hypothetical protein